MKRQYLAEEDGLADGLGEIEGLMGKNMRGKVLNNLTLDNENISASHKVVRNVKCWPEKLTNKK